MKKWYDKGIKFECQGSGKCCSSRGEYGYVYLTKADRKNMAKSLNMTTSAFSKKYCSSTEGVFHLKENQDSPDCIFLNDNKCDVYTGRPTQCKTWPFWPDHMGARSWNKEVVKFCPGVGKGKVYSKEQIEKILEEERIAEQEIFPE